MSDAEILTRGRLERMLGMGGRFRAQVERLARSLDVEPRRFRRDDELATAVIKAARAARTEVRL